MAGHDRRHQADGARARDQHVLGDEAELRCRVHGIPKGVEDRGDVEVDLRQMRPQVSRGHHDELGESTIPLHANAHCVRAERPASGHAVATAPADDMPLGADELAGVDRGDILPELDDLADELVADDQSGLDRVLGPLVPRVDVEIGAADAGAEDADQDLSRTRLRLRHVLQP